MNDEPKYLTFVVYCLWFLFFSCQCCYLFLFSIFFIFYTIEIASKIFKILIKLINHMLKNETKITNVFIIYNIKLFNSKYSTKDNLKLLSI